MSWQNKLQEWHTQDLISEETVQNIERYEAAQPRIIDNMWRYGLTGLASLCICLGILFIVAANWQHIPFSIKLTVHMIFNLGLGGYLLHLIKSEQMHKRVFEICVLLLSFAQLSLMALIGQHFQITSEFEDVMCFWWLLIAPLLILLGRGKASALLFFSLGIYCFFAKLDINIEKTYSPVMISAAALYFTSLLPPLKKYRPAWADLMQSVGFYIIFLTTFFLTIVAIEIAKKDHSVDLLVTAIVAIIALIIRFVPNALYPQKTLRNDLVLLSAFACLILLSLSTIPEILSIVLFCGYFLAVGWIANLHEHIRLLSLAIVTISVRLIIYFAVLTDNLFINGLSMIGIGIAGLMVLRKLVLKTEPANDA